MLIGSDGEKSLTRNKYGIGATGYNYNQNGLVCTVETVRPNEIAFQRFLKTGPIALLPLWGNYSSIVWSCPYNMYRDLEDLSDEAFIHRLNEVLQAPSDAPFLGGFIPSSMKSTQFEMPPIVVGQSTRRFSFPLGLTHAGAYTDHRMALIGDAAHRIHPMAGQGLNLGLSDVAFLANTIIAAKRGGADIGNKEHVLEDYAFWSRVNAETIIRSIEFIKNSYSPVFMGSEGLGHVLSAARNLSIDVLDSSDFLKYNIMNYASGSYMHPLEYQW